jgi:hypothetical protein
MKKNLFFTILMVLALCMVCSCGKKKKSLNEYREEYLTKPSISLTQSDSTEVKALVDNYLQLLRDNQFEDAVDMLYYMNGPKIIPMPDELKKPQLAMIKRFRGIKYELDRIVYSQELDNIACYVVTLFEKEKNDPRPNTAQFFLKPVRVEGRWYLTMADSQSDKTGTHGTLIKN